MADKAVPEAKSRIEALIQNGYAVIQKENFKGIIILIGLWKLINNGGLITEHCAAAGYGGIECDSFDEPAGAAVFAYEAWPAWRA